MSLVTLPFSLKKVSVSNNMIRNFQTCRRLFFFTYGMQLVPITTNKNFILGTYFGKGLDQLYSTKKINIPGIMDEYWEAFEKFSEHLLPDEVEVYHTQAAVLEGMLTGYVNVYGKADFKKYSYITHEPSFEFSIAVIDGVPFFYNGRIDLLLKNLKSKETVLVEHKTVALQVMDNNYLNKLSLDTQVTGYIPGAQSLGHNVKEILYNMNGKCALRKKQTEDDNDFKNRIIDDYIENGSKYFKREVLRRTSSEISTFKIELVEKCTDILFLLRQLQGFKDDRLKYFYKCEQNCITPYGPCQFMKICKGKNNLDMYELEKNFITREEQKKQ